MRRSESAIWAHRDINAVDPHLQYLRVDGYRPMESDLNMDGYNILNVGLINGIVDVENHASRHQSGGADSLDGYDLTLNYSPMSYVVTNNLIGEHIAAIDDTISDFQAGTVPGGRTFTAGDGLTGGGDFTADRTFNVGANVDGSIIINPNDIQIGVLATDSQHGNRGGGLLHELADTGQAGFLSIDGYNKLEGIEDGAQVNTVDSVFGRTGVVVAIASDYNASQIDNDSFVPGMFVSDALNYLDNQLSLIDLDGYALDSDLQSHISDTANPHATSIANIGSGTLAQLNAAITDATLADESLFSLVDGTRPFTGPVGGVTPVAPTDLTTKAYVDSFIQGISWQEPVLDKDLTAPPGGENTGYRYIVAAVASGDWLGYDGYIAEYNGSGWDFTEPSEGFASWVEDEDKIYIFTTTWQVFGSVIDHGNLIGLNDDDHTQYLLVSGTRAMTGSLDMGTNSITNVNLVDGVDVSTHASRHQNGGDDEIDGYQVALAYTPLNYNAPVNDLIGEHIAAIDKQIGITDSTITAHIDNTSNPHSTNLGNLGNGTLAELNTLVTDATLIADTRTLTAGAGLTGGGDLSANRTFDVVANADGSIVVNANDIQVGVLANDSQHGNLGGGSLHDAATTSVAGFMSAVDKTKLDGIDPATTVTISNVAVGVVGIDTTYAREDHKHQIDTTGTLSTINAGDSLFEGSADGVARKDHQHAVATGTASGLSAASINTEGSSSNLSRADHTHQIDVTTGTLSTINAGDTAQNGTADGLAKRDHQHAVATAEAVSVGASNAEGISTSLARADHTHSVTDLNIASQEQGSILYFDGSNWVELPPGEDGYYLQTNGTGANPEWTEVVSGNGTRTETVQFALTEGVNNTIQWFFLGSADTSGGIRSSSNVGMQNANGANPYVVPFDATITKAILLVKGVGVQNGSVTYPVIYQTDLMDVGFTGETKAADIDFSISNSFTVGTFSVGTTNFRGTTSLNISVSEGDTLGLKFINGTGASLAGQTLMAFVTLILEEA